MAFQHSSTCVSFRHVGMTGSLRFSGSNMKLVCKTMLRGSRRQRDLLSGDVVCVHAHKKGHDGVGEVAKRGRAMESDASLRRVPTAEQKVQEAPVPQTAMYTLGVALVASLLVNAASPEEAFAARSGGRVGGSSFSSRPRSAPRAAPRSGPTYNYYSAPPLVSPYGGFGFGFPFFGGGLVAPFPLFGIGSLFNIMILFFILNVVLTAIKNFTNSDDRRKDDSWDDDRW